MSQYKKGIETKNTILTCSAKLFYQYGYKNVSLQKICKESNVKLGTLTYYFRKKDDVIVCFYNTYMKQIYAFLQESASELNPAQAHIYMILLYYYNIYRDCHVVRFHKEVLEKTSMYHILYEQNKLIKPFIEDCELAKNEEMFDLLILADNAVRRELNIMANMNQIKTPEEIKALVSKIYTVTAQLFSYPQKLLHAYIEEGYAFLLAHQKECFDLLGDQYISDGKIV